MSYILKVKQIQYVHKFKRGGTTLFEVLLYIALFSIVSAMIISFYISFAKSIDALKLNLQKTEISLFIYTLAQHKLDTFNSIDSNKLTIDINRILKYYPNFKILSMEIEYISQRQDNLIIIPQNIHNLIAKVTFEIKIQNSKNFTHSLYISSI